MDRTLISQGNIYLKLKRYQLVTRLTVEDSSIEVLYTQSPERALTVFFVHQPPASKRVRDATGDSSREPVGRSGNAQLTGPVQRIWR